MIEEHIRLSRKRQFEFLVLGTDNIIESLYVLFTYSKSFLDVHCFPNRVAAPRQSGLHRFSHDPRVSLLPTSREPTIHFDEAREEGCDDGMYAMRTLGSCTIPGRKEGEGA